MQEATDVAQHLIKGVRRAAFARGGFLELALAVGFLNDVALMRGKPLEATAQGAMPIVEERGVSSAGDDEGLRGFLAEEILPGGFAAAEIADVIVGNGAGPTDKGTDFRVIFVPAFPEGDAGLLIQILGIGTRRDQSDQKPVDAALVGHQEGHELVVEF